jgi:Holliday junction resolvase RusA-like endonuclease
VIQFTVPGIPVPQPRAKATSFGGRSRMYTPTKTPNGNTNGIAEFKAAVRIKAAEAHRGAPLDCPLKLTAVFLFPRTKGITWKSKPMPRQPYVAKVRNDIDNLIKSLCDAMTGVVWVDDGQVYEATAVKMYAAGDEQPRVEVKVEPQPQEARA